MKSTILSLLLLSLSFVSAFAAREEILINDNWNFRFSHQVQYRSEKRVDLPHTWNAQDALSGKQDYYRGMGNYDKQLFIRPEWDGKRVHIRFEGVNTVANVLVNNIHMGEHRGGYGAFVFDITDYISYGKENKILVKVNNALQLDIMPLVGDFNFYGGIYRDVKLVITDPVHISLTDYASPGVYLIQDEVTREKADVRTKVILKNTGGIQQETQIRLNIRDGNRIIIEKEETILLKAKEELPVELGFTLKNPRLWNGREDPFMYQAEVIVLSEGKEIDRVIQPLGVRYFHIDADKGFFLNGEHVKLHGVCRHQDRAEIGNALRKEHHDEDAAIMLEMGANAVRLAHYPQASYFYDLMDRHGLVVWAEIPFIGPGGYQDRGFTDQPSFRDNGKEQLKELIRQHFNHPSICFWGLYNELKTNGDNPVEYVKELNELAHHEDPTRLTTAASFISYEDGLNTTTDIIAWNQYFGWYGGSPSDMATWADHIHAQQPHFRLGISEYGAGASIYHQQDSMMKPAVAAGWWHPENFQTYFHMGNWKAIAERPFIWGSFIWNLFDFGAAHREEGDRPGINDKGLVTFDRKIKKDTFYFYKANWNKEDKFIYIANRRHNQRVNAKTDIMVFSNLSEVELWVNGNNLGRKKAGEYATFLWTSVSLMSGENQIEVRPVNKKDLHLADQVCWRLNP